MGLDNATKDAIESKYALEPSYKLNVSDEKLHGKVFDFAHLIADELEDDVISSINYENLSDNQSPINLV